MKQITFKDLMECDEIQNPYEQQLFLLSRFFNIPEKDIKGMPIYKFMPLMEELNKYLESQYSCLSTKVPMPSIEEMNKYLEGFTNTNNFSNMIENRFEILDL